MKTLQNRHNKARGKQADGLRLKCA